MKLTNNILSLEFSKQGDLLHFAECSTGRDYLADGDCKLFRLTLTETENGKVLPGILRLVPETAQRVECREEPEKVTFSFIRWMDSRLTYTQKFL